MDEGCDSPVVVLACLIAEKTEARREEGLEIGTAKDMEQWHLVLVGPVGAIHHENVGIGALHLDLLPVGKEEALNAVVGVPLDFEDPVRRREIIQQGLNWTPAIQMFRLDLLPIIADVVGVEHGGRILLSERSQYVRWTRSSMCHCPNELSLSRCTLMILEMSPGTERWSMVVLRIGNLKPPSVIRRIVILALHPEDRQPEGTSCLACVRAPDCRLGSICLGLVALVIIARLDVGVVGSGPVDVEAIAMLHSTTSERTEGCFVGGISGIRRRFD